MFLFEQTLLEEKQGALVTVPTPVTEAEMEEQFSQYMCESIRLQTAMVKADRKCTENYLEVTTESDKEAIKAIFEATVKDFIKKSKDAIVKAIQTLSNWIKDIISKIQKQITAKAKELSEKVAELNKPLVDAMDKVEVEFPRFKNRKRLSPNIYKDFLKSALECGRYKKKETFVDILEDMKECIGMKEFNDQSADIETREFSVIKKDAYEAITPSYVKETLKIYSEGNDTLLKLSSLVGTLDGEDPLAKDRLELIQKVIQITKHYFNYTRNTRLASTLYAIKAISKSIALAPKHMTKKEATKESVSLLDDMLASI